MYILQLNSPALETAATSVGSELWV